jgi:hypothetical protein
MDFLNSKHLTSQDGFIHPFRETGTFTYAAEIATEVPGHRPKTSTTIVVENGNAAVGAGEQHDIIFHWDVAARQYLPREEDMRKVIKQNDFIVFHFVQAIPGQPPCFIAGRIGDKVAFDSRRLQTHDAFTHFFLTAGDYSYRVDQNIYRVSVADHREFSIEEHEKMAKAPVVILVDGGDLSLKQAKIVAGQTVIWAVHTGENVSIEVFRREQQRDGSQ